MPVNALLRASPEGGSQRNVAPATEFAPAWPGALPQPVRTTGPSVTVRGRILVGGWGATSSAAMAVLKYDLGRDVRVAGLVVVVSTAAVT